MGGAAVRKTQNPYALPVLAIPMRLLYTISIHLYNAGIAIAALFNEKARLLYRGRKATFPLLAEKCAGKSIIWLHAASLGEYEQGKPLIQKLKQRYPNATFLVTFFSPSGYEVKKNDPDIDIACYLPADTPRNVRHFLDIVRPQAAFFVKYEYWYNYMKGLKDRKIPFYYLSAIFRPSQYFFKPYGRWFARQLQSCTRFFVQNEKSCQLLKEIGIEKVTITGDTRFDRVYAISQQNEALDFMEEFKGNSKLLVVGSSWQPDETVVHQILAEIKNDYKIVFAPHVISKEHVNAIKSQFSSEKIICFSERTGQNLAEYNLFIIDTIGLLSRIYKYADVAMVGGGFETGLHNTLEAAVFGIPVFFGPKYAKFNEAIELVRREGGFSVQNAEEMRQIMARFKAEPDFYQKTCRICSDFVKENLGACDKILAEVNI